MSTRVKCFQCYLKLISHYGNQRITNMKNDRIRFQIMNGNGNELTPYDRNLAHIEYCRYEHC